MKSMQKIFIITILLNLISSPGTFAGSEAGGNSTVAPSAGNAGIGAGSGSTAKSPSIGTTGPNSKSRLPYSGWRPSFAGSEIRKGNTLPAGISAPTKQGGLRSAANARNGGKGFGGNTSK